MSLHLARRLYGSALIAAHLPAQSRIPYLSRDKLEALRDAGVRKAVAYAARYVPFYQELFSRAGIAPEDIRTAADLERLPLIDKETLRSRPDAFVAGSRRVDRALGVLSSGSTGTPMRYLHDPRSVLMNIPYGEREREPVMKLCGSFRPKELYVGNESAVIKQVTACYNENALLPVQPRRRYVSVLEPFERIVEILNAERPDMITGYGGWLALFFKTVAARGLSIPPLKLALYVGEALPPGAREHITRRFGVPVLSRYCSAEAFKIGFMCERQSGFHVHEDICLVRAVDGAGRTLPDDTPGELVISNLINRGTVLLNYKIGDLGALSGTACGCGRSFRLLSELEGRVEDIVPLPGGRFVHPRAFWEVFRHEPRILQYQVVQLALQRFEVKLVTVDGVAFDQAAVCVTPRLREVLGGGSEITVVRQLEFDRGKGQKFRTVASHVARGGRT